MTKGGVRGALKLIIIDVVTELSETVMLLHLNQLFLSLLEIYSF
jgi:hypothetical protein